MQRTEAGSGQQEDAAAIRGIGQIALGVSDLDRSESFYRDVLGLRHLFRAPPAMSFFACGDVRLLLGAGPDAGEDRGGAAVYYRVGDIAVAHDRIRARGGDFVREPHRVADLGDRELWLAFLRDPDGHLVGIMSEPLKSA
jgi:methylmalonyl-CoA/ethylmalonyl-CoA epimerase